MSGAYYNENDASAAVWLRELIRRNLIAPGDVDTRSIEDVRPIDLRGYVQCHFFAGIGGWSRALRLAGWPDDRGVWTGSCPCQPFSDAGAGAGFADQRHLWPAWLHLIAECRPAVIFGEQVASAAALRWWDLVSADLEGQIYACAAADLCAASVGAPHIRQRLYWVAAGVGQADTCGKGLEGRDTGALGHERAAAERSGCSGRLGDAYANSGWRQPGIVHRQEAPASQLRGRSDGPGLAGDASARGLANTDGERRDGQHVRIRKDDATGAHDVSEAVGCRGAVERCREQADTCDARAFPGAAASDALHGFWRAADWLGCRDGKWRPVEPSTFPLADGLPARVGRLRGYGNAIVPQVAAEFVAAYLETRADTALFRQQAVSA